MIGAFCLGLSVAIGRGAYDFLAKPVEMGELKIILKRAFHVAELEREFRKMERWQRSSRSQ